MNFSEAIQHSSQACFSHSGEFLASSKGAKLSIFAASHLSLLASYTLLDVPAQIEWAEDSEYLLCAIPKKGLIQVFSRSDPSWSAKISLGLSGLSYARWTPDSRQVLTITEFQLRLTVWSLVDKSVCHIRNPKHADKGLSFSADGKFMALAERLDCKDYVGIYYTQNWQLINVIARQHFQTDTMDMQDLVWTQDDTALVVWDHPLECRLLIYSPVGNLTGRQVPYTNGLGVKSVSLSPNCLFLAAGFYDQSLRVYNHISWRQIIEFPHSSSVPASHAQIYREEECKEPVAPGEDERVTSRYGMQDPPLRLPTLKVPTDKPNPPIGVSICAWSPDSRYLATRNDSQPTVLWIWDMLTLTLSVVLIQLQPIKSVSWSPRSLHLVICTGTPRVFLWSEEGASVCEIPFGKCYSEARDFAVQKVKWSETGQALLLMDKAVLMVAYPQFETV
jgi:WD40 repeat protein